MYSTKKEIIKVKTESESEMENTTENTKSTIRPLEKGKLNSKPKLDFARRITEKGLFVL